MSTIKSLKLYVIQWVGTYLKVGVLESPEYITYKAVWPVKLINVIKCVGS